MNNRKIYTPEGFNDLLHEECYYKKELESLFRKNFQKNGYKEIELPVVEYYDVFSGEDDLIPQEDMFKFFDQQGRILVLRPDITIPVARVSATKYKEWESPLRFFYIGNSYKYSEIGGGRQKEFTQAGAEIIGVKNIEADAEVIITAVSILKESGLENFQIDLGQVDFINGIMEEAKIEGEKFTEIKKLINNRDTLGIKSIVNELRIDSKAKEAVLNITEFFGSKEVIERAKNITKSKKSLKSLENLKDVLEIIDDYGYTKYVSIDLSLLPSNNYHTGIIFKGFTHGIGFPILRGGRYDKLLSNFGQARGATGFSIGINFILAALDRQKYVKNYNIIDSIISYCKDGRKTAFGLAKVLRKQGLNIEIDVSMDSIDNIKQYAKRNNIKGMINIINDNDLEVYNFEKNTIEKTTVSELKGI